MKKPTYHEVADAMKVHTHFIKYAGQMNQAHTDGTISSWVQLEIISPKVSGGNIVCTKVFVTDKYIQASTEYIDKRRKKRFLYDNYGDLLILVHDLIIYMINAYKKDYHMNRWSGKMVQKWGKSPFHDQYDEHINGKVIATF
jgi:hypothetical protein